MFQFLVLIGSGNIAAPSGCSKTQDGETATDSRLLRSNAVDLGLIRDHVLVQTGCRPVRSTYGFWTKILCGLVARCRRRPDARVSKRLCIGYRMALLDLVIWFGLAKLRLRSYATCRACRQSPSPPSPHRLGLLGDWLRVRGVGFHHISRKHKPEIENHEP